MRSIGYETPSAPREVGWSSSIRTFCDSPHPGARAAPSSWRVCRPRHRRRFASAFCTKNGGWKPPVPPPPGEGDTELAALSSVEREW